MVCSPRDTTCVVLHVLALVCSPRDTTCGVLHVIALVCSPRDTTCGVLHVLALVCSPRDTACGVLQANLRHQSSECRLVLPFQIDLLLRSNPPPFSNWFVLAPHVCSVALVCSTGDTACEVLHVFVHPGTSCVGSFSV